MQAENTASTATSRSSHCYVVVANGDGCEMEIVGVYADKVSAEKEVAARFSESQKFQDSLHEDPENDSKVDWSEWVDWQHFAIQTEEIRTT